MEQKKMTIDALMEQGMEKLVLDVRDNLGGSLYDVTDIAGMFLPEGSIITTIRSRTSEDYSYKTKKEGIHVPIALLVNGHSASASELLAGALKDYSAAELFGKTMRERTMALINIAPPKFREEHIWKGHCADILWPPAGTEWYHEVHY